MPPFSLAKRRNDQAPDAGRERRRQHDQQSRRSDRTSGDRDAGPGPGLPGVPIHALPTYGGDPDGVAAWINDKGQVVGSSGTCAPSFDPNAGNYLVENHALLWENGTAIDLGNLGTQGLAGNHACEINNQGQVVGHTNSDTSTRAYLWTRATAMQNLGTLSGDFASLAIGINDGGEVVGLSLDGNFNARAFLWEKGVMTDLNSLIASNPSGLKLQVASSINSSGEIIGVAQNGAGETRGFLATPH